MTLARSEAGYLNELDSFCSLRYAYMYSSEEGTFRVCSFMLLILGNDAAGSDCPWPSDGRLLSLLSPALIDGLSWTS